jgi:diacylglycerol O-acyltransferase / wax synthase
MPGRQAREVHEAGEAPEVDEAREAPEVREAREVRDDRRMTDVEALMWTVEKDRHLDPTFGSVTLLDQPPDVDRLRRRVLRMVQRIPRLHQRVVPSLGRLAPPEWHDDPDFDVDHHLRRIALPAPGTPRQLYDLAATIVHDPLDRTRPLWEFTVVEGLEGGRAALVQKMHHTITDGEGGIRMSEQFIDASRDAPDIDEVEIVAEPGPPAADVAHAAADALAHTYRRTVGVAHRAAGGAVDAVTHPSRLVTLPGDAVELARSALRQVTVTDRSHSPIWVERSLRRRLEVLDVPFDEAKLAAGALGGSLNDLFVAGVAGGAGAYHRQLGAPVEWLRMAMPVSTRQDRSAGGNAFVPTRVLVPAGVEDPVERFRITSEALTRTKHERVISAIEPLAGLANLLPTSVLTRLTKDQARTIDFTTSNVRAAPFDLYIAGAHIEATYALGPLSNTAFNLTMMSYRGSLNMGLHLDDGAVPEPHRLRRAIEDSFAELLRVGA